MKTKKINVVFEEVTVIDMVVDLGNIDDYMSAFLSLKNHERNTDEILEVRGINDSNSVHVVLLIDENSETVEIERSKRFVSQFGKIERYVIDTAWILDKDANNINGALNYNEWYVYG